MSLGGGDISSNSSIHPIDSPNFSDSRNVSSEFIHGGGAANSAITTTAVPLAGATSIQNTAAAGKGAASALPSAEHTSPGEAGHLTKANQALLSFDFKNPFVAAGLGSSRLSAANSAPFPQFPLPLRTRSLSSIVASQNALQ